MGYWRNNATVIPPSLGIDKHYGYAFQWLALAATLLVFYVVTHVRRGAPE